MKKARDYYDEFSAGYDRTRDRPYHALVDELESALAAKYGKGGRVLDAGCGTGLVLERLREECPGPVGVDLSRGMLLGARRRGFTVMQADVTALPFKDASFDLAFCFKVLPHVARVGTALGELARVTRPGGHIVVDFYNSSSLRYLARGLKGPRRISSSTTDRDVYTRYDGWGRIMGMVPPGCRLAGVRGVRILTPHPAMLALPLIGGSLRFLERRLCDGPLKRFAGFVVLVLRRM